MRLKKLLYNSFDSSKAFPNGFFDIQIRRFKGKNKIFKVQGSGSGQHI
jgi:hypothetical protein